MLLVCHAVSSVILAGVAGRILLSYTASKLTTEMIREVRNDLYGSETRSSPTMV